MTAAGRHPLGEDADWAARAVRHACQIDHRVIPAERLPLVYARAVASGAILVSASLDKVLLYGDSPERHDNL